ncbi:ParB/RepB/Spo0J family partition protein [Novosphingopyxis sp.]|uniref:ParB/RepB/Spo0J family partition protein n=1 Tax=Novosphingopyxis sp. TaxID=2709690 RepID=UPI003B5B0713
MFQNITLNKLVPSPRNVRSVTDSKADAQLKADIAARGLLQNLVVRKGKRGKFEVEAGGRRLAALKSLANDGAVKKDMAVTCLVIEGEDSELREVSLAENFQRLAMNAADEAGAFAAIIEAGSSTEDVARRFGVTVRFVEGRLRLASLAPCVFEALAEGSITLDLAKAYGATSDIKRQAQVFEEAQNGYYQVTVDSVRRMVLNATIRGDDPRAILVGREAYVTAGGRIERELFDDDYSESWLDIALLEQLAMQAMNEAADVHADRSGLAWVRPTLDCYVSHDLAVGLSRLPTNPAPLSEEDAATLSDLEIRYDDQAAILEDEDSSEGQIAAAEAELDNIDRAIGAINNRPPVLVDGLKSEAGAFLVLSRDGEPVLAPQYYTRASEAPADEGVVEIVEESSGGKPKRAALSQRLIDELAMQRRDILALHVGSDPALALDLLVFTLADEDSQDWRRKKAITISGPVAYGPVTGFEAKDAPATASLAELSGSLDESWRAGANDVERFKLYRELSDETRSQWLAAVVARTLIASLNVTGDRQIPLHDALGEIIGIDIALWWRPTAANYFDRVPKALTLEAFEAVGGPELSSRYASSKKADLAATAERIFSGNFIAEAGVKERAIAWVPEVMRLGSAASDSCENAETSNEVQPEIADQAA